MALQLLIYALSFVGIWVGSGIAISSTKKLSSLLHIESYVVAFVMLGALTSLSELFVGVTAIRDNDPEIFVGNLIGASIVLFLLIIPLLVIRGKRIHVHEHLQNKKLILPLTVVAMPIVLSLDGTVDTLDALISLLTFGILIVSMNKDPAIQKPVLTREKNTSLAKHVVMCGIGIVILFVSSYVTVEKTVYFSRLLNVSPFLISLLVVSIGTNLPELSFIFRPGSKNTQIAFGDYMGSAAFNTFLFGFLTLIYGKSIQLTNSYLVSLAFLLVGLLLFFIFARSKNTLTRAEGLVLLALYVLFVISKIALH